MYFGRGSARRPWERTALPDSLAAFSEAKWGFEGSGLRRKRKWGYGK